MNYGKVSAWIPRLAQKNRGTFRLSPGFRPRDHYDPQGNPMTPGQAHPGNSPTERTSFPSRVGDFVRQHPVAVGVGVVVVGGTAILLTGGAAAPALALAF